MQLSFSIVLLASLGSASAFLAPASKAFDTSMALRMSEVTPELTAPVEVEVKAKPPQMSQSLPWMTRPAALDGSMPGDAGFDPLGFAKNADSLLNMREAEIRHARLAMLAAAGWPLSELFNAKISSLVGMTALVDATDRAPSVLNGGLGKVPVPYWIACFLGTAAVEFNSRSRAESKDPNYFPGNLGFDPLGLYGKDEQSKKRMELAEIKNGRLAMIAITAFAVQEFVYRIGVVDETPIFFKPIGEVLAAYANSGYIQH
jgi:hypothetical protein